MPINVVIFGSIPEAILVISLGLILIGERPPFKRTVLISMIQGFIAYYIRSHFGFGIHTLLQYGSMCILVCLILRISLRRSMVGVLLGVIISSLTEGVTVLLVPKLIGLSIAEIMSRSWVRVGLFIPHLSVLTILDYLCLKYNFTLENEIGLLRANK